MATTLPSAMVTPTRGSATTPAQVQVDWVALTLSSATGGLAITSYRLEYDAGTGQATGGAGWQTLVGDPSPSTLLSYTASGSGTITSGAAYRFRVAASNVLGWGPWSGVATVDATAVPGQMTTLTTVPASASA